MFTTNSCVTIVEIGLERLFYTGSEENGQTEEICAVILANDATFVNGVAGVFNSLNLASISATITPTQRTGGNAASGKIIHQFSVLYVIISNFSSWCRLR